MNLTFSDEDEAFREEVRAWLDAHLVGEVADLCGAGGPGREDEGFDVRLRWERLLGEHGWVGLGWSTEYGGRGATLMQQVIWAEEYTSAGAPARVNHMGENLLGPTIIAFGTPDQQARFLPPILRGEELWCQGYSEPDAGSDLANVQTRAVLEGDEWVITGQKVWTSLAHVSHWCFVVARTDPAAVPKHRGISFLLVPMDAPGIEVRPIVQISGTAEFNEVFFDGVRTPAANVVGSVNGGWAVTMGLLGFERGVSTLAQQIGFKAELDEVISAARTNGRASDPTIRQRLARSWSELRIMRFSALRTMTGFAEPGGAPGPEASIQKLFWASWHRRLGELWVDILGMGGTLREGQAQNLFLFSRSDTIYGGSNQIQRNIIGERVLGLPPEPKVASSP